MCNSCGGLWVILCIYCICCKFVIVMSYWSCFAVPSILPNVTPHAVSLLCTVAWNIWQVDKKIVSHMFWNSTSQSVAKELQLDFSPSRKLPNTAIVVFKLHSIKANPNRLTISSLTPSICLPSCRLWEICGGAFIFRHQNCNPNAPLMKGDI